MTRNDLFFKILFVIQIAVLPLVLFAYLFLPNWTIGIFVAAILIAKIWSETFREKENRSHLIINVIGSMLVFGFLLIMFYNIDIIPFAMMLISLLLIISSNLLKLALYNRAMPEFIDAADFCYILFEIFTLLSFTFIQYYYTIASIGLFAIILTTAVSVGYKIYYIVRYTDVRNFFRNLFRSIFRKK